MCIKGTGFLNAILVLAIWMANHAKGENCEDIIGQIPKYKCGDQKDIKTLYREHIFLILDESGKTFIAKLVSPGEQTDKELSILHLLKKVPGVERLQEHYEFENQVIFIFDYQKEGDLNAFQVAHPDKFKDTRFIIGLFRKLVLIVEQIHKMKVVHTNIYPENILISQELVPRIIDFDLAVTEEEKQTRTGMVAYIDPQIYLASHRKKDFRKTWNDIYSLGVVLYEMLHGPGQTPFMGAYESDVVMGAIRGKYTIKKGIKKGLVRILHACLRMKHKKRPTIPDLLRELQKAEMDSETSIITQDLHVSNKDDLPQEIGQMKVSTTSKKLTRTYIILGILFLFIIWMIWYMFKLSNKSKTSRKNLTKGLVMK